MILTIFVLFHSVSSTPLANASAARTTPGGTASPSTSVTFTPSFPSSLLRLTGSPSHLSTQCTYVRSEARIMKAAGRAAPTAMDGMYTSAIR